MKNLPMVSIIIPVYNGANYLKETIESALAQTYDNFEIIVVNDGSTDDGATEKIALSYGDRIRYIAKENGGVSSALNCGIKEMKGEYFSWLSHDDKYESTKLEDMICALSRLDSCDKVIPICGVYYIDANSAKIKDSKTGLEPGRLYTGREMIEYMLLNGVLNGCAMLIPKGAFEECGGFDEELRYNQDALMWYKMFFADYSVLAVTDKFDVMYRLHAMQDSKRRRDLLLVDSVKNSKIIGPAFISISTKKNNLFKEYTKAWAKHNCSNALYECIEQGKAAKLFCVFDVLELKLLLILGKCRNAAKKVYRKITLGSK